MKKQNSINEESDDNMLSKHHTFKKFLGSGGFGCVSHFTDKLGLDQAIKRIRIAYQSGQQLKDLDEVNEICILHKCSHPNIVKIHQYWFENQSYDDQFHNDKDESFVLLGSVKKEISKSNHIASFNQLELQYDSDGESCKYKNSVSRSRVQKKYELDHIQLYIKMEQIDGWVLGDFKEHFSTISKTDQQHIIKQIHDSLLYTHTVMKIGHRDVKPENIMIVKNDIQGNMQGGEYQSNYSIKLLDFGISKFINDNPSQYSMEGTPLWISPEQQKGVINFQSDMFSFGLVIFWLFTNSTETQQMTSFNKLRCGEVDFQGRKSKYGHPDALINLVRLICIDRIDSWTLAKKSEWIQFKNQLEEGEDEEKEKEKGQLDTDRDSKDSCQFSLDTDRVKE